VSTGHGTPGPVKTLRWRLAHEFRWFLDRHFDRLHGTETSGRVELARTDVLGEWSRVLCYEPISTKLFRRMIARAADSVNPRNCTFIDFGSGKGRTLLLAADYPWKAIVGVEFAPRLHEIAKSNIETYAGRHQQCFAITSELTDAVHFEVPPTDLVVFMHGPFRRPVMQEVLSNLARSAAARKTKVVLVYFDPSLEYLVERCGLFCRKEEIALPREWSRSTQRRCMIYYSWQDGRIASVERAIAHLLEPDSLEAS
jgi:SAM-dependent methyltransferase